MTTTRSDFCVGVVCVGSTCLTLVGRGHMDSRSASGSGRCVIVGGRLMEGSMTGAKGGSWAC